MDSEYLMDNETYEYHLARRRNWSGVQNIPLQTNWPSAVYDAMERWPNSPDEDCSYFDEIRKRQREQMERNRRRVGETFRRQDRDAIAAEQAAVEQEAARKMEQWQREEDRRRETLKKIDEAEERERKKEIDAETAGELIRKALERQAQADDRQAAISGTDVAKAMQIMREMVATEERRKAIAAANGRLPVRAKPKAQPAVPEIPPAPKRAIRITE